MQEAQAFTTAVRDADRILTARSRHRTAVRRAAAPSGRLFVALVVAEVQEIDGPSSY